MAQSGSELPLLAHHWLVAHRGGEQVFEAIASLFPGSAVATLVASPGRFPDLLGGRRLHASALQAWPGSRRWFRALLPWHPHLIQGMKLPGGVPWVFTSDAAMIKGLPVPRGTPHVCYCHSPPRYLWDVAEDYLRGPGPGGLLRRWAHGRWAEGLRGFDRNAADRVSHFIANSSFVAGRIRRAYGREAEVLYPAVDVATLTPGGDPEDFYLVLSQLVPYKRVDLAVAACRRLGRRLVVIGEGPERDRLMAAAGAGRGIEWLGWRPRHEVRDWLRRCRALLFPGVEDFGIVPLEAMACGRPVIARRAGGALETMVEGSTGIFFDKDNAEGLLEAILAFEAGKAPDPVVCRQRAEQFSAARFKSGLKALLQRWGLPAGVGG